MAPDRPRSKQKGRKAPHSGPKSLKRKREEEDIDGLNERVHNLDVKPTTLPTLFSELPLCQPTQSGLSKSHFKTLTPIQAQAIPLALKGTDILGAAKTGSGKTLAFLVPVLENLFRKRWTEHDGLGALILSPTRELAIQIFDVLRQVGRYHTFSAGLVIGGKSLQEERERLGRMNILVATPGRMLQHLDQTSDFQVGGLQMMVLDEADRIMDMGFQSTVDAVVEHLPHERQTLLFSATQTKRVSDLGRLSLLEPEFISTEEASMAATPESLQQNYVLTPLPKKLDTLWSFIRANLKKKILVFLSSGKQVRFVYESFRHLQPGVPILHVHGRQKQTARLDITMRFSSSKYACLFATDVAARGLDFPAVDWVVQVDCPEDADTYIHRVGRTARYQHQGNAILFLDPSEEAGMLKALEKKRIALEKINVRESKMQNTLQRQLQNMCFKDPELKYLGQKCFSSYVRSVFIQKDKSIFRLKELDLEQYAASLGLPGTPSIKFAKGEDAKARKNAPRELMALSDDELEREGQPDAKAGVKTKYDRMFERRNQDVLTEHYKKMIGSENMTDAKGDQDSAGSDSEANFLAVKRRFAAGDESLGLQQTGEINDGDATISKSSSTKTINFSTNPDSKPLVIDSKRREKLLKSKKKLLKYKGSGSHVRFDEDGNAHPLEYYEHEEEFHKKGLPEEQREAFLFEEKTKTRDEDVLDKEMAKEKRREKKEKRKRRQRDEADDGGSEVEVRLPSGDEAEGTPMAEDRGRGKEWFEDALDENRSGFAGKKANGKKSRRRDADGAVEVEEPRSVKELEALAQSLLAHD